jgi:hypothetical protein
MLTAGYINFEAQPDSQPCHHHPKSAQAKLQPMSSGLNWYWVGRIYRETAENERQSFVQNSAFWNSAMILAYCRESIIWPNGDVFLLLTIASC